MHACRVSGESDTEDVEDAGLSREARASVEDETVRFRVGMPHTSETRRKISAANKGKVPWNKGRKHSEETKRKIAEATRLAMNHPDTRTRLKQVATGRKHTPATRRKIASACIRSRAVRDTPQSDSESEGGERPIIFGNRMHRTKKEAHVPFEWAPDTIATINERIHTRASATDFSMPGSKGLKSNSERVRRPMSAETRAKLSARIKELWADPDYRERVSVGVKRGLEGKGSRRSPLSDKHRENIRQSLLRRSARLRGERAPAPRRKSSRRAPPGGRSDLIGSKLAGQVVSDEYGEYLAARNKEESLKEKKRKEKSALKRQKPRAGKETEKHERKAIPSEAEQQVENGLLLEALASAGQLPPLSGNHDASLVSGVPSQYPNVFASDGLREAGAGGLFEAVNGSSASGGKEKGNRLVFSSGNGSSNEDEIADVDVGDDSFVADHEASSDHDIHASREALANHDRDDGAVSEDVSVAFNGIGKIDSGGVDPADSLDSEASVATDDCGNVVLESDEDVDSLLAEVARAENATAPSFAADETEPTDGVDEVEDELDDVWTDAHSDDAIGADDLGPDAAASATSGGVDIGSLDSGDDLPHTRGLSVNATAAERRESLPNVGSITPEHDRKRVVTYVNGVAESRFVD